MPAALRLLFLGTPEFAVPALRCLAGSSHPVVGVVSQPDRPRGRGRRLQPTPVRQAAEELGLDLLQPGKCGAPEALEWMARRRPDLGVVVAFGQFVPRKARELPPLGMINAHASLLPRWRGAAPIERAIAAGDERSGISVMRMVRQMDAGGVCLTRELEIGPDETAGELAGRLSLLAAEALLEALPAIAAGEAVFEEQDAARATPAPKLDRDFARVDWARPAAEVYARIRAATPRPGVDVALANARRTFRILACRRSDPGSPPRAGRVRAGRGRLWVAADDGWIEVLRLQVQGRRALEAADFLRGSPLDADERVAA